MATKTYTVMGFTYDTEAQRDAFNEGYDAYQQGVTLTDYPDESHEKLAWYEGWKTAKNYDFGLPAHPFGGLFVC